MPPRRTPAAATLLPLLLLLLFGAASAADVYGREFDDYFKDCHRRSPDFDSCVLKGLNDVRHFFPTGIPEYGVLPFDPFFAKEVVQKRGGPGASYKLRLRNVYERGWTRSNVTKFRSDLDNNRIVYSQFFPEKSLDGEYEIDGDVLQYPMTNKGSWNMTLYDYSQTTTITRRPTARGGRLSFSGPLKVRVHVDHIGNMDLHVGNLLRGRSVMERMLDRMINTMWRVGLGAVKPLVNDLVSTAFTEIFNNDFKDFPFDKIFPP
ncbi:uncharacterized protein LOC124594388 [Schistocerca americana]|uniref:uncharacterized protein LOC124594388 n=1 Tax=Schistocerca americana TaxID=7009 RepID=UPI001F4FDAE1|nr:uncharacterized protein LOC124594388 [Schistocerca americana]